MTWADKKINADLKAIQQREFFGQLENPEDTIVAN